LKIFSLTYKFMFADFVGVFFINPSIADENYVI
jgi:hypothetical protein